MTTPEPKMPADLTPPEMGKQTFGQWLKAQRVARGLTLRDVERITEGRVSNAALSQIETGKIEKPNIVIAAWLSAAYGLEGGEIMRRAVTGNKPPEITFCPHCGQIIPGDRS